jgi:hypothetical protein
MNEAKHTPGPWQIDREFDQVHIIAGRAAVARVMHGREDGEANARLIKAAPNMLETLEWLDSIGGLGATVHERIQTVIKKARQA